MSRAASSAGSRGTKGSRMSRSSYRRVAPTSQVDEALFGNTDTPSAAKRAGSQGGGRRGGPAAADVVSMESIEKLLGNRPQANAPDSTISLSSVFKTGATIVKELHDVPQLQAKCGLP